ncbi:MAG: copper chaperone PCu(A)C [Kordiimonadaceae bacterium]|nr:copper chaperone PCu(A)C [Kordiimonadaceae bacterium]
MKFFVLTAIAFCGVFFIPSAIYAHDGDTHDHGLLVEGAWAPHTGKRTVSAAVYLIIKNIGKETDTFLGVETSAAASAMLHQSKEVDGFMRMDHVESLTIEPGASATFSPGSYHIMLTRLETPLKRGEIFTLNLAFEKAGVVPVIVEITGIGGPK